MWVNESCRVMCRRRWNLWLLTLTIGFWMICFNGRTVIAIARWTTSTPTLTNYVNKGDANGKSESQTTWANTLGYAAEWDYEGGGFGVAEEYDDPFPTRKLSDSPNSAAVPSRRVGPGTWQGANGSWWIFGGQGPTDSSRRNSSQKEDEGSAGSSIHFLSDLWLYDEQAGDAGQGGGAAEELSWRLVYSPRSDSASPISSYPDNIAFPVLCGSESNGHLAVFGGGSNPRGDSRAHNSPFVEDNIVWLYDMPRRKTEQELRRKKSEESDNESSMESTAGEGEVEWTYQQPWNGTEGLWTSYICCDACLPDGNTTLEFCPQFSGDPILWCGQDSLMALQFTSPPLPSPPAPTTETTHYPAKDDKLQPSPLHSIDELFDSHPESPFNAPSNPSKMSYSKRKDGREAAAVTETDGRKGKTADGGKTREKRSVESEGDEEIRVEKRRVGKDVESWRIVNWWKFDLGATEWIKMPEVNISVETGRLMSAGGCRTVDDGNCVYILCPAVMPAPSAESTRTASSGTARQNLLSRTVLLFDPKSVSIRFLGQIALNNAFRDRKVWQLGRSVFHALRSDNHTVIFLAYHKLLDLWIHDHQSNAVYAVENVWKGSSLHIFQRTTSFYKLSISLPSTFLKNPTADVDRGQDEFLRRNYSFYMVNPRTKLFTFDDPQPAARFHVTIVTDKSVFLPSRDASFLITADTVVNKNDDADKSSLSGNSGKEIENSRSNVTTHNITATTVSASVDPVTNTSSKSERKEMSENPTLSTLPMEKTTSQTSSTTTTKIPADMYMIKKANKAALQLTPKLIQKSKLKLAFISALTNNSTKNKTIEKSLAPNSKSNASVSTESNKDKSLLLGNHIRTNKIALKIDSVTTATPISSSTTSSVTEAATLPGAEATGSAQRSGAQITEWTKRLSWRSKSNLSRNHSHNETNNSELKSMGKVRVATATAKGSGRTWTARTTLNKKHILGTKQTFAGVIDPAKRTKGNGLAPPASPASSLALNNVNNERAQSSFAVKSLSVGSRRTLEIPLTPNDAHNSNLTQEHSLVQLPVNSSRRTTERTSTPAAPATRSGAELISTPAKAISLAWTEMSGREHSLPSTTISSSAEEIAPFDSGGEAQSEKSWSESSSRILQLQSDRKPVADGFVDGEMETEMNSPELIEDVSTAESGRRSDGILEDEEETGQSPLTYGSSEIMIESRDDVRSIGQEGLSISDSAYSSMLFFSISLTIFATFGVVLFVRRCVKCPPRRQSVLIKEPPPIQYSVIPDELSFRTPVV